MMLMRRELLAGGGQTIHGYNAKGLLGFWDGEYSSIDGNIWKSLTGNYDMTIVGTVSHDAENKRMYFDGSTHATTGVVDELSFDEYTFEAVWLLTGVSTSGLLWLKKASGWTTLLRYRSGNGVWQNYFGGKTIDGNDPNGQFQQNAFTRSNEAVMMSRNGVQLQSGTFSGSTLTGINEICMMYYKLNSAIGRYKGYIYSARLYNRVLTADELAANYAVDEARFGIT